MNTETLFIYVHLKILSLRNHVVKLASLVLSLGNLASSQSQIFFHISSQVMGLMLGEFIDEYTVRVVDVFSMPQSGNSVSVEAVDPVFQTNMLDMLKQTGRPEMVRHILHGHFFLKLFYDFLRVPQAVLAEDS